MGFYWDSNNYQHGFIYGISDGTYTPINAPSDYYVVSPAAINKKGDVAGSYEYPIASEENYGFVYIGGTFKKLNPPNNIGGFTFATGINDSGVAVGHYYGHDARTMVSC